MATDKENPETFRASRHVRKLLAELVKKYGENKSRIICRAIEELHRKIFEPK